MGRSDNMVKIRGINLYPIAVGAIANEHPSATGEYICRVERDPMGRDEMIVRIEVQDPADSNVRDQIAAELKLRLGIAIEVEIVRIGATADLTQVEKRQKAIRLVDNRFV